MKANELRIGNYYNQFGNIEKVSWVTLKNLEEDLNEKLWCKPIPLTKEWLVKFGFLKDLDNDIYLSINPYAFLFWQNDRVELLDNDNNFMISYCKYVHQLQNLYFALTGDELTIK